jgi:hypothetical protein
MAFSVPELSEVGVGDWGAAARFSEWNIIEGS